MKLITVGLLFFLIFTVTQAAGQGSAANQGPDSPRSPVRLLPGYKLQIVNGIDTFGAVIWREHGAQIYYELGPHLDDPVASKKDSQILWKQEQLVNGKKVQCMYTKSHQFVVNFPELRSYFSARIHNRQELAEMLLMTLTYGVQEYPVDPSLLAPLPKPKN